MENYEKVEVGVNRKAHFKEVHVFHFLTVHTAGTRWIFNLQHFRSELKSNHFIFYKRWETSLRKATLSCDGTGWKMRACRGSHVNAVEEGGKLILCQCILVPDKLSYVRLVEHHDRHGVHSPALLCCLGCHPETLREEKTFELKHILHGRQTASGEVKQTCYLLDFLWFWLSVRILRSSFETWTVWMPLIIFSDFMSYTNILHKGYMACETKYSCHTESSLHYIHQLFIFYAWAYKPI